MGLSEKAMLVKLSISQWTARKHDKGISAQVEREHQAHDAGRYNKNLIAKAALETIQTAAGAARTFHYANTRPWEDEGSRILPASNYLPYTQEMRKLQAIFDTEVSRFLASYDSYVDQARIRLNGMFNAKDYPRADQITNAFKFSVDVSPLPEAADFRVSIGDAEAARIRADIQARNDAAHAAGDRDLWNRLHTAVSHVAEKLGDPEAIFRDSLIENVRELCDLLPRLNVTGDPELDRLAREANSKLTAAGPKWLRESPDKRAQTAQEARAILDAMAAYCGPMPTAAPASPPTA